MVNTVQPVILCGGAGSRLWPLSRTGYPKQFLCLNQKSSLFQLSVQRLTNLGLYNQPLNNPLIVTNEEHRFLVAEQMRNINVKPKAIILEDEGRNTAPALLLAALKSLEIEDNPHLLILSADHQIRNEDKFRDLIDIGKSASLSIYVWQIPSK